MNPREIEVRIEERVLHEFVPGRQWDLADALQEELNKLLTQHGIPAAWQTSPDKIDAGRVPATPKTHPPTAGTQIARAVYEGVAR